MSKEILQNWILFAKSDLDAAKRLFYSKQPTQWTYLLTLYHCQQAIEKMDFLAATSSIESSNDKRHLRNAVDLEEFSDKIFETDGKIGLVVGRELKKILAIIY